MGFLDVALGAAGAAAQAAAASVREASPRIGKSGPPIVSVDVPSDNAALVDPLALQPKPALWFGAMTRADWGDTGPMMSLFDDARDRDSHMDGVAGKRTRSMMGRPIVFRPPDGFENDKEAVEASRLARRLIIGSDAFRSRLTHLMQGAVDGYAVSPIRWRTNSDGLFVPHLGWEHSNRFGFDRNTLEIGKYHQGRARRWVLEPLSQTRDGYVVHMPMGGRSSYPWRRGALRSCIIPSYLKRNGLKFWLTLAERFGMPQPYAIVPDGWDDDGESESSTVGRVKAALKDLGRHWYAVFGSDVEIKTIEGSGKVTADVHKELISWAETTISIALLGQNLTTKVDGGGSFAAAESHRFVADDLHLADSVELGETLTQQLVKPLIRYNMPGAPVPVCEISTGIKASWTLADVQEGVCTPDEYRRAKGWEAMSDEAGADYRRPISVQVPVAVDGAPSPLAGSAPVDPNAVEELSTGGGGFELVGQITALKEIVLAVTSGEMPQAVAVALIMASLPMSKAEAEALFADFSPDVQEAA